MIYLIDIEAIPNRYSEQWRSWIPKLFDHDTVTISGTDYEGLTDGGFFDFTSTNIYKSEQSIKMAQLIKDGKVKDGDVFFFYDVWHPGVINLKYMLDLACLDVKICGMLHAGAYDKTDILGMHNLGRWCDGFEESVFKACDQIFVATDYHRTLIHRTREAAHSKITVVGWPYDFSEMDSVEDVEKENIVVFPHRISPDKQPDQFDKLAKQFPDYKFVKSLELNLSKQEYHAYLKRAKFVFSAALHENLGLATFEAVYSGCIPILPKRCSYTEMYFPMFLYEDGDAAKVLADAIERYDFYRYQSLSNADYLKTDKFNFKCVLDTIQGWNNDSKIESTT